jgi:starvation-inducible DNA-binding protein
MTELEASLNVVLSNTFVMAFKCQSFHWNVEGKRFHMYHKFFEEIYDELFETVDVLAENIRMIDGYSPYSLNNLLKYSTIDEESDVVTDGNSMVYILRKCNDEVIASIETCIEYAEDQNDQGLLDLLGARIAAHKKHGWMLKSTDKEVM